MGTIHVDGVAHEVDPGQNLLQACLSLGMNLPYFCWHPAMGSVGACRQCAVKQFRGEADARGKIVMACMTPAAPGTRISIEDPEARAFRAGVIEGLMLNHPHDCPVCDEGGECHLQDMTVMTGHAYRRSRFPKRTFKNQYLGPFLNHEMNRCIQCYRCVRFYREYAGGRDLQAMGLRNHVYFGRAQEGVLENEFAGNLVEVCPTGVFTDATLKHHYTRKWDLRMAPAVCVHCGLGCNVTVGERYGLVRRIVNRYHGHVNGWFLCDRGRFGYEFVNSEARLRTCRVSSSGEARSASEVEGLNQLVDLLGAGKAIGIGSPRASVEANFALRALVGPERFFSGVSDELAGITGRMLELLGAGGARTPSLREVEQCDAALVLGEDPANSAPRLALALRQAARRKPERAAVRAKIPLWLDHPVRELAQGEHGPLFLANPEVTYLDDVAEAYLLPPDGVARLGYAVAHALDPASPEVSDLSEELRGAARSIAGALAESERPLVVSGASGRSAAVIECAAHLARALASRNPKAALLFCPAECNSFGLGLMEAPGLGAALEAVRRGLGEVLIVLENDLFTRLPARFAEELLARPKHLIALDSIRTPTVEKAELALPAATFAEGDGTFVNNECRAQRSYRVLPAVPPVQESWRWIRDALRALGRPEGSWEAIDDVARAAESALPALSGVSEAAPPRSFRLAGEKVAREPHRCSGRTAALADIEVSEPKPPDDADSALMFTMEGYPGQAPSALIPFFWSPGWNSIQATKKFQEEVNGPLRGGDAGVRLPAAAKPGRAKPQAEIPPAFQARPDELLVVPLPRAFGTDELSRRAPAIAERTPLPSLLLDAESARRLSLGAGQEALLTVEGVSLRLPVSVESKLPRGVAGLPLVAGPMEGLRLPAWGRVARAP